MINFKKFLLKEDQTAQSVGGGRITETHNGTRRLPLSQKLRTVLANGLAGTGLNWHSFSGGQLPQGPRVGGPRHDYGNASDGEFKDASGRSLNGDNPSDRAKISQVLGRLRQAGILGVGWDSSATGKGHYMGSQRFHLDVYGPGVWGHTRSSNSAAQWVVQALGGMPTGGTMIQGDTGDDAGGGQGQSQGGGGEQEMTGSPEELFAAVQQGVSNIFNYGRQE